MISEAQAAWWRPDSPPDTGLVSRRAGPAAIGARVSVTPFWALMLFTFILILAPQSYIGLLVSLRIGLIAAAAAAATYLVDRLRRGGPFTVASREMGVAAGLLIWAVLTVPLSYWPGGSVSFLLAIYLKTLVIFWLLANVVCTEERLKTVAWGLSLMAAPLAAFAIKTYLSGQFIDDGTLKRIASYEAPLTQNPNDLALMLNLILPLTLALFLAGGSIAVRAVLAGLAALDVLGIILSFSRAGFLTLGTTALIYAGRLLRRPERGFVIAGLALALLCLPLLPPGYLDRLGTISNIEADPTGSAQARWTDTLASVRFVLRHPIVGAGIGMNILALNDVRGPAWKDVHNVYLEHAVDLGLPGLTLFLLLFAGCIRAAGEVRWRAAGEPGLRDLFCLAEGIQTSLAAFAIAALFHPIAYHFYFYYMAGLALAVRTVHAAHGPEVSAGRNAGERRERR